MPKLSQPGSHGFTPQDLHLEVEYLANVDTVGIAKGEGLSFNDPGWVADSQVVYAPGAPQNLVVESDGADLVVAWEAPLTGDTPVEYEVTLDGANAQTVAHPTLTYTYVAPAYATYDVAVVARNAGGDSPPAQELGFVHEEQASIFQSYPNLVAAWDARDLVGQTDGQPLSGSWTDILGANALSISAGAPIYRATGIGSAPAIEFDGDDMLSAASLVGAPSGTALTVVIVADPTSGSGSQVNGMLVCMDTTYQQGDWWWGIRGSDGACMADWRHTDGVSGTKRYSATVAAWANSGVHAIRYSGNDVDAVWYDGTKNTSNIGTGNYGAGSPTRALRVGGYVHDTGGAWFTGLIAAIAIYDTALSDGDMASLIADLESEFGI